MRNMINMKINTLKNTNTKIFITSFLARSTSPKWFPTSSNNANDKTSKTEPTSKIKKIELP